VGRGSIVGTSELRNQGGQTLRRRKSGGLKWLKCEARGEGTICTEKNRRITEKSKCVQGNGKGQRRLEPCGEVGKQSKTENRIFSASWGAPFAKTLGAGAEFPPPAKIGGNKRIGGISRIVKDRS